MKQAGITLIVAGALLETMYRSSSAMSWAAQKLPGGVYQELPYLYALNLKFGSVHVSYLLILAGTLLVAVDL